jgi:DNA repair exonuclease SbcCD ATPase subunit
VGTKVGARSVEDRIIDVAVEDSESLDPTATCAAVKEIYGDAFEEKRGEAFELASVMLGETKIADLHKLHDAGLAAIEAVKKRLFELPDRIAALDAKNDALGHEADALLGELEKKKGALEQATAPKGLAKRIFGALSLVDHTAEIRSEMNEIERGISKLETDRAKIGADLARHRSAQKPAIEKQLARLQKLEAGLYDALDAKRPDLGPGLLGVAIAKERLDRRAQLLENLEAQLALLEELHASAEKIGLDLGALVAFLTSAVKEMKSAIEIARTELEQALALVPGQVKAAVIAQL